MWALRVSLAVIAAVSVMACVHVQSELLVPVGKYPPVAADEVRIFTSEAELRDRGYEWELVAILIAKGSADYTSEGGMLRKLREEAGKKGANGLLLGASRDPNFGERLFFGSGAQRKREVMALRWWEAQVEAGVEKSATASVHHDQVTSERSES